MYRWLLSKLAVFIFRPFGLFGSTAVRSQDSRHLHRQGLSSSQAGRLSGTVPPLISGLGVSFRLFGNAAVFTDRIRAIFIQ